MNFIKKKISFYIDGIKANLLSELEEEEKSLKRTIAENEIAISKNRICIENLETEILNKSNEMEQKNNAIKEYKTNMDVYEQKIKDIEQQYKDCVDFGPEIPEAYGLYDRVLKLENSTVYKKKIDEIREKEKALIKSKSAIITDATWRVNNNLRNGNMLVNRMSKIALRAFNGECDAVIASIKSYSKSEGKKNKISTIFNTINELISTLDQSISTQYLNLKLEAVDVVFDYENALDTAEK